MDIESFFIDRIKYDQPLLGDEAPFVYNLSDFLYGEISYAFLLENEKKRYEYIYTEHFNKTGYCW